MGEWKIENGNWKKKRMLFVGHHRLGRGQGTKPGDLGLHVAEFLFHKILAGEERIVRHLKNRERRRNEALQPITRFKIGSCGIQSPEVAKINVKGERKQIEFVKIP